MRLVDAAGDVPEEFETRRVSPVEVFEHDEDRSDRGKGGDEVPHLGKECGLTGDAFEPPIGEGSRWWRQVCPRAVASDKVEPGTVGRSIRQVVAVAGEDEHVSGTRFPNEVAHERRLADPGGAAYQHESALASNSGGQVLLEACPLPVPSDQRQPIGRLVGPRHHVVLHGRFLVLCGSARYQLFWSVLNSDIVIDAGNRPPFALRGAVVRQGASRADPASWRLLAPVH
jgi:hypothetical protein